MGNKLTDGTIKSRDLNITVVGLGYVGLPEALAFHDAGYKITGIDTSKKIVNKLNNGLNPLRDSTDIMEIPNLSSRWKVVDSYVNTLKDSDIIIVAVPTPINSDKTPDLGPLKSAIGDIIKNINDKQNVIIIIESTVYPGVTNKIINALMEKPEYQNKRGFTVAYCPERVNPGDPLHTVTSVSRVIGCDDKKIGIMIANLYSTIIKAECRFIGSIETAEASKLIENVQRDIDIAFVNELAIALPKIGLDVEEVLDAASTKWNFHRHTPGIGVGGHCIPIDPYYYLSLTKEIGNESQISKYARNINEKMPKHVADSIQYILSKSKNTPKRALILGYSYKPEIGDVRETPIKNLYDELKKNDIETYIWDPYIDSSEININIISNPFMIKDLGIVIIGTAHKSCIDINWEELRGNCPSGLVYDGRRSLEKSKVEVFGWKYYAIGRPI